MKTSTTSKTASKNFFKAVVLTAVLVLSVITSSLQSQWHQVYGGQSQFFYCVSAVNSNTIIATGETGLILRSTNGGTNWQQVPSGTNYTLENLSFSGNTGIATSGYGHVVIKTTDGGASWMNVYWPGYSSYVMISAQVINDNTFIIASRMYANMTYFYNLRKTTNRGVNWIEMYNTPTINDVQFISEQTGYIFAGNSTRKTTNGGYNWVNVSTLNNSLIDGEIEFINENTGYLTGSVYSYPNYTNRVYKTTDGGINWVQLTLPSNISIRGVDFINVNCGMIAADSGLTFRTTNGGLNWTSALTNYSGGLADICMTGVNNAITVGSYSVIFKYTDLTGITQQNNQIPEGFTLTQNYPNPFNPSTKISFSIPKSSFVKMAVYDVTGKEVGILVNENMNAGSFEVDFNASKLTSGVYFCRISADGFTDVKKMMLVK